MHAIKYYTDFKHNVIFQHSQTWKAIHAYRWSEKTDFRMRIVWSILTESSVWSSVCFPPAETRLLVHLVLGGLLGGVEMSQGKSRLKKELCLCSDIFLCEGDLKFPLLKLWQIQNLVAHIPAGPVPKEIPRALTSLTGVGFKMVRGLSFFLCSRILSILRASRVLNSPRNVSDGARKRKDFCHLGCFVCEFSQREKV